MTPEDWIDHVRDNVYSMSAELILTGQARLTNRYCMVCGEYAALAYAVMDPSLEYRWKPCGHVLEIV